MENEALFKQERIGMIGGTDIASILGVGKYSCALRTYFSKKPEIEEDFSISDKPEVRRGKRLEAMAVSYYMEKTGRRTKTTDVVRLEGKPHIAVHMDRIVYNDKEEPGYLECKVVGTGSFYNISKNGLPIDYITQLQYGMRVAGFSWGSYAIYCPERDGLLYWDVAADKELGNKLIEEADSFWSWHVEAECPPEPLPQGSPQCRDCNYFKSCPNSKVSAIESNLEEVTRDDLASDAERMIALREERKALEAEEADLKAKIMEEIKSTPGTYKCGQYMAKLTQSESERFDSKGFKAHDEALWKKFTKITVSNTLKVDTL